MATYSKQVLPAADEALAGREQSMVLSGKHFVHQRSIVAPFPESCEIIIVGLGCFWGAERLFWKQAGVWTTAVGYAGGYTENPTYEEVCSGGTGHTEAVLVVFDPGLVSVSELLKLFWESHDPTQGMRQGNDMGTQYRSAIYATTDLQQQLAEQSREVYQQALYKEGRGKITTEIKPATDFYYAEEYHQQYLARNVNGYCGIGGTGICMPPKPEKAAQ